MSLTLVEAATSAVASVDDPEYPGISIVDLGLLQSLAVSETGDAIVGLTPTFAGCPALTLIADEVSERVRQVNGIRTVDVSWLRTPIWSPERMTPVARQQLATEFTVGIQIGSKPPECPRCGSPTHEQSMFGPSRCRSVHRCTNCAETVEVMRA